MFSSISVISRRVEVSRFRSSMRLRLGTGTPSFMSTWSMVIRRVMVPALSNHSTLRGRLSARLAWVTKRVSGSPGPQVVSTTHHSSFSSSRLWVEPVPVSSSKSE